MKFLKKFTNHTEYETYTADTAVFIRPNVSRCVTNKHVHYNPRTVIPPPEPQYRWTNSGTTCDGYDKYYNQVYEVSYDNGATWSVVEPAQTRIGDLIERDSEDCGYTPPETRVVAKFNVTNTSSPTQIISDYADSPFSAIEIDGVAQPSVVSAYTFSTTGEHTVKYTLTDPTSIGTYVFRDCTNLTSIDIPSGVTSIGGWAFWHCNNLTSVNIPNSVTSIGTGTFRDCGSLPEENNIRYADTCAVTVVDDTLSSYSIKPGTKFICDESFSGCSNLTSIVIPDSVISIGAFAFYNCGDLTTCHIGSGVTYIDCYVFHNCTSLTTINIPNGVTEIDKGAFRYCTNLTSITIPNSVTTIGDEVFDSCTGLTSITMTNSVTSIGASAFTKCYGLTSISIPSGITNISKHTFWGCSGLTSITIPDNVTNINNSAFSNCSRLLNATFGSGVTSIGNYIFYNCSALTSITCNATIAPSIQTDTFEGVKTNGTLYVPQGSTGYDTWMQNVSNYLGYYNWTKVEQ